MLFNGYDVNTLDVAEYACCTRSPPSRDSKKMWSTFECDSEAICPNWYLLDFSSFCTIVHFPLPLFTSNKSNNRKLQRRLFGLMYHVYHLHNISYLGANKYRCRTDKSNNFYCSLWNIWFVDSTIPLLSNTHSFFSTSTIAIDQIWYIEETGPIYFGFRYLSLISSSMYNFKHLCFQYISKESIVEIQLHILLWRMTKRQLSFGKTILRERLEIEIYVRLKIEIIL